MTKSTGRGRGRPKGAVSQAKRELAEMAKEYAEEALSTLVEIARTGESESARVTAATAILDRAYGRPFQSVQLTGDPDAPVHLVRHEIIDPPPRE